MIAGDRVNRFADTFQWQVEIRLVVLHFSLRIHHVGRDHHELHRVPAGRRQHLSAKRVLRRITFSGIADDDEREVAVVHALGRDGEHARRGDANGAPRLHRRIDHRPAPVVHARLRNFLPRGRGPVLAVEIPTEAPDRMHGDQHGGERQSGANHLTHGSEQRVVLEIARHAAAQALFRPPANRAFAPPLMDVRRGVTQHAIPGGPLNRSRQPSEREFERIQHDQGRRQRRHHVTQRRGGRRDHAQPGPFRIQPADMNRKEHDDEDEAPVEVEGRAPPGLREGIAVDEPDHRMRRQPQRSIGMLVFRPGEFAELAVFRGRQRLPAGCGHAQAEKQPEAEHADRVAQPPHEQREQDVGSAVDDVPQVPRANTAVQVGRAVHQQHGAQHHHQAAERKSGLKRDQRAGEDRVDGAAVMRPRVVGIPGIGKFGDAREEDRDADNGHAPYRQEQRRQDGDGAEDEQQKSVQAC